MAGSVVLSLGSGDGRVKTRCADKSAAEHYNIHTYGMLLHKESIFQVHLMI